MDTQIGQVSPMDRPGSARWLLAYLTALASIATFSGCAVVESEVVANGKSVPDGIPYFLPRRPFIITVSMPVSGTLPLITVAPGNAEPDLQKRFVLSQGKNLLANNEFNITVGPNGLLKNSSSTATSQVATALQNAAASAAMFGAPLPPAGLADMRVDFALPTNTPKAATLPNLSCPPAGGSYQYAVYPESNGPLTLCQELPTWYAVTWARADGGQGLYGVDNERAGKNGYWSSGIFFRHEIPYLVTVTSTHTEPHTGGAMQPTVTTTQSHYIITSPDKSETAFFPVNRSFFANNTANVTITDGVLTGVDQTTTSEVASLVGLPATFVSSYTTAVGQLFTGLTSVSSDQQKLLQQMQATALTQNQASVVAAAQYQVCTKTLAKYNWATMTPADAATALAAIKTACPGN